MPSQPRIVPRWSHKGEVLTRSPLLGKGFKCRLFRNLFLLHMHKRQLFLKEDIYQMLEYKRERMRHLAALTLQRYARMFFVRKRYLAFRKKIIWLQAQCRGYLTRLDRSVPNLTYIFAKMRVVMVFPLILPFKETLCEDEAECSSVPFACPLVHHSKAVHHGRQTLMSLSRSGVTW